MLTKERIEAAMALLGIHEHPGITAEIKRLALVGLERDELAERVGRAVLGSGITAEAAIQRARDLRNAIGSLRLSSPCGGRTLESELRMYDAIADELRKVSGRG